ncbi:hypothetical protein TNCV_4797611 [Trichonephila clavipes]|nr:hypothetical protein TNCV_4797611 [Trichonephila clavipes]
MYAFDAGAVNSQSYRDEILEACVRFFWLLWALTTFFMDENVWHHRTHIADEFHECLRGLRITILLNMFEESRGSRTHQHGRQYHQNGRLSHQIGRQLGRQKWCQLGSITEISPSSY